MIKSTIRELPKKTVEMNIHIPWEDIKETYDRILQKVAAETEIPGFRKGKAPRKIVEKKIDQSKVYEKVAQEIVPKAYADEIKKHDLKPVTAPKVQVEKADKEKEWILKATIALKPTVNLKNYKQKVKLLKKDKTKIWVPGDKEKKDDRKNKLSLDDLIKSILEEAEVEISDLLITEETNRLLSNLIDQTQKLGMSVEQYLLAKGKTSDQIKSEYKEQAERNLKIEFILAEIADSEKITVAQEDIDKILKTVEKEEEKAKLQKDSYYLAHLIRQQKTLDFLNNL